MKFKRLVLFVFLICSLHSLIDVSVASENTISKDQLIDVLEDLESTFKSYSLTAEIDSKVESSHNPNLLIALTAHLEILAEITGRFRFTETGTSMNDGPKPDVYKSNIQGAFDGSVLRQMNGSDGDFSIGTISPKSTDSSLRIDPRVYLTYYFKRTISEWIKERDGTILGEVDYAGRKVISVETAPKLVDGIEWKQSFLIDPALNFSVIKRAALLKYAELDRWIEYTHIITSDYLNPNDAGIWVPQKAVYESFVVNKQNVLNGDLNLPTSWKYDIRFENWEINPAISNADFVFEFKSGVYINDRITGRSYTYNELTDQDLADQLAAAGIIPSRLTPTRWLLIINAIVLCCLLIVYFVNRSKSKRNQLSTHQQE